jgi:hypothetical protein
MYHFATLWANAGYNSDATASYPSSGRDEVDEDLYAGGNYSETDAHYQSDPNEEARTHAHRTTV